MTKHRENIKILTIVGLNGSGKSTAVEHLTRKGFPKVGGDDIISQIHHLIEAGQHRIITDSVNGFEFYQELLHEFHHAVTIVAITTNVKTRHARLSHKQDTLNEYEMTNNDWEESSHDARLIALADYFIPNDGSEDELYAKIDELLAELEFAD